MDDIYGTDKWWKKDENQAHREIFATIQYLDNEQSYRHKRNLRNLQLYDNRGAASLYGSSYTEDVEGVGLKLNVVRAVVDTAMALAGSSKARPVFLVEKNWDQKRKANALEKFIQGQFYNNKQYEIGRQVARSAFIFGTGFEKIYPGEKDVEAEYVFANDIILDDMDALRGEPRQWFQATEVQKESLREIYPDYADDIGSASILEQRGGQANRNSDTVTIVDAWYLRRGESIGRHVMCIENATFIDEEYHSEEPPFATFRMSKPERGYLAQSMVDSIVDIQVEINFLLEKVQRLMTLDTSRVWIQKGSAVNKKFTNDAMTINEYQGSQPIFMAMQGVSPVYTAYIWELYHRAFESVGVSMMHATAEKPAGLNSGTAQRNYHAITTMRFKEVEMNLEQFYMDAAKLYIESAKHIKERDGSYEIMAPVDKNMEALNFSDVDMDESKYIIQVRPAGFLPIEPAGQIEQIKELAEIDPRVSPLLLRQIATAPDVAGAVSYVNAPLDMVDDLINEMLHEGNYRPPEPWMDLVLTEMRMNQALLRADIDGAPEDRLEMLRRFLSEVKLIQGIGQEQQSAQIPGVPAPQGGLEAQPQPPGAPVGLPEAGMVV